MKLGGLLKDKRTLYIGGAAALGLGVLIAIRRGSGSGSGGSGATYQTPTYDSSASDTAAAIQAAQESWASDLREFSGSVQSILSQLNQTPSTSTNTSTGSAQRLPRRAAPPTLRRPPEPTPTYQRGQRYPQTLTTNLAAIQRRR